MIENITLPHRRECSITVENLTLLVFITRTDQSAGEVLPLEGLTRWKICYPRVHFQSSMSVHPLDFNLNPAFIALFVHGTASRLQNTGKNVDLNRTANLSAVKLKSLSNGSDVVSINFGNK